MKYLAAFLVLCQLSAAEWKVTVVKPPAAKHKQVDGLHSHWCEACKIEWWHDEEKFGNEAAHKCPKCGSLVWEVHQETPAKKLDLTALPILKSAGGCPPGGCPAPARPRGRR